MIHKLKIDPIFYNEVLDGNKSFEIRFNDRNYKKGDELILMEYDANIITENKYTGNEINARVNYVSNFNQKKGWVVLGIFAYEGDTK